jgi:hypothetical protein
MRFSPKNCFDPQCGHWSAVAPAGPTGLGSDLSLSGRRIFVLLGVRLGQA